MSISIYDEKNLAENYYTRRDPNHPLRNAIYETWLAECGNVKGKSVLDLGCGSGESSRRLARVGAEVSGIDNSEKMLAEARRLEKKNQMGIKYASGDMTNLKQFPNPFDLIVACYVFHYLPYEKLRETILLAAQNLRNGGKLVAINQDPVLPVWHKQDDRKGLIYPYTEKWIDEPFKLNSRILIEWYNAKGEKYGEAINYFIDKPTWEGVLSEAGFCKIKWSAPQTQDRRWANIPACITIFSAVFNTHCS